MNQGPIWGQFLKKTRGRQSRATVPLRGGLLYQRYMYSCQWAVKTAWHPLSFRLGHGFYFIFKKQTQAVSTSIFTKLVNSKCSLSLWRVVRGSKLMHLDLIHGLFITYSKQSLGYQQHSYPAIIVSKLMGWVRNVVLIKCICGSGKPRGGRDFG